MKLKKLENFIKKFRIPRYNSKVIAHKHMQQFDAVQSGPFEGLSYLNFSTGSKLYPKILGTYEKETHSAIEEIISTSYNTILNVGAAEGYFAVGFAKSMDEVKVIAFELESKGRSNIRSLAEINGVENKIDIHGECTTENMCQHIDGKTLLFMDVEGAEDFLLDPMKCEKLLSCDIFVEVHEHLVPGLQKSLKQRFANLKLAEFQSVKRTAEDFESELHLAFDQRLLNGILGGWLKRKTIRRIVDEYRKKPVKWYFFTGGAKQ